MKKLLYIGLMSGSNGFTRGMQSVFNCQFLDLGEMDRAFQISDEWKPDIVFFQIQNDGHTDVKLLRRLKFNGAYVINWTGDVRDPFPQWFYEFSKHIDLTTFSNMKDVIGMAESSGATTEYMEIGYDPDIFKPDSTTFKGAPEVVFMGNNFGHFPLSKLRIEMIRRLYQERDFKFGLYGSGWNQTSGNYMGNQVGEATIYRSCKIAINLSHFSIDRYSSDRLIRILGSGAFCLTHRWDNMDYTDGEELVVWEDLDDLCEKIKYYLANPQDRKVIAEQGQEYVADNHTFAHMAANIEELYLKHS